MNVYEIKTEIENKSESDMPNKFIGAFVCLYVASEGIEDAINKAKIQIERDKYHLIEMSAVVKIKLEEWEDCEGYPSRSDLISIYDNVENILYSSFNCYDHIESDRVT